MWRLRQAVSQAVSQAVGQAVTAPSIMYVDPVT
jgi:hypothetical protein